MKKRARAFEMLIAFGLLAGLTAGVFLCPGEPLFALTIPLDGVAQGGGQTGPTDKIAFVDIEVLFNEHPMKKRFQGEFFAESNNRKKAIDAKEKAIQDLFNVITTSTTELNHAKAELSALQARLPVPAAQSAPFAIASPAPAPQRVMLPGTTEAVVIPAAATSSQTVPAPAAPAATPEQIAARQKEIQEKESSIEAMKKELLKLRDELAAQVKQDKADLMKLEEKQSGEVMSDLYKLLDKIAKEEGLTIILNKNDVLYGQPYQDITQDVLQRLQGR